MTEEPKYQFEYGPDDRPFLTRQEAIDEVEIFMKYISNHQFVDLEPVWFIYLHEDQWHMIAGSVVNEFGKGELIKEFNVKNSMKDND